MKPLKLNHLANSLSFIAILLLSTVFSIPLKAQGNKGVEPFLGRWALFLPGGAGWLEIRQEPGYLDGDILWYGGSVVPVDNVYLADDVLVVTRNSNVVRKKDDTGKPSRTQVVTGWLELRQDGAGNVKGISYTPKEDGGGVDKMEFTGKLTPALPLAPDLSKVKYGKPIKLFNGKDLSGWKLMEADRKNGFKVKDGVLANDPVQEEGHAHVSYGNLRTVDEFEDFNLKLEVNVPAGSNSGVYLRGIYEVQVFDSYRKPLDPHNMGAIYSRITPVTNAEKPAGEWQALDMTLCDRHVTVILNGTKIIDNQPLMGVTGGALTADEFIPGPIYLQGDHGNVMYRNIVLTPIIK